MAPIIPDPDQRQPRSNDDGGVHSESKNKRDASGSPSDKDASNFNSDQPQCVLTIGSLSSIRSPFKATGGIFAVDALNISRMNMHPRGKQAAVHQGYTVGRMSTKGCS